MSDENGTFVQYRNFIRKLAWSYNKTTGIEYEELFSEASIGYVLAMKSYKAEKKVPLINWIGLCVKSRLNNYLKQNEKVPCTFLDEDTEDNIEAADTIAAKENLEDLISRMSPEAKYVCNMILTTPAEYSDDTNGRKVRGKMRIVLREQGWTHERIWGTINELKSLFQEGSYEHNPTI